MKNKPIVVNIKNLIGKITVEGQENASTQITQNVSDALSSILKTSIGCTSESDAKDYYKAKCLLQDLIETASRAIIAIDDKKPHWEISNIAIDEIEELNKKITVAIVGDISSFINKNFKNHEA